MTNDKSKTLFDKHSKLFPKDRTLMQSLMAFGFECDDGWYAILDELFSKMIATGEPIEVVQVKEKYGTLRVYITGASEAIYDMIDVAEEESSKTCEACGGPGKLCGKGWVQTLCVKCDEKNKQGTIDGVKDQV
jgi:hypothetical protein